MLQKGRQRHAFLTPGSTLALGSQAERVIPPASASLMAAAASGIFRRHLGQFGASEGIVAISGSSTISANIFPGPAALPWAARARYMTIAAASAPETGLITINSGTLVLSTANASFSQDPLGILLRGH